MFSKTLPVCLIVYLLSDFTYGLRDKKFFPKDYTYIESEESFYKIHTTGRTFTDAKQTCDLEGATLYYAENVQEVNAVASFWNRTQPSIPWVWVGLTDKTTEGYFETVDRRPISEVYSNWQKFQPDNSGDNEDCVHMDLKGTMNDYICDTKANFICKKSLQSLQGNYNCDKPNSDGHRDKKFLPKDYTYIESEESFYKIHTTGQTFADAKQTCALEGATLYYAENVEEVNAVASFWSKTQPSIPWVWVGLTDKMTEGYFVTIDQRPISKVYSNWQKFQPNNSGDNEDCVHMDLKGTMNDYICDTKANFICKKSLQSLQGNYNCDKPKSDGHRRKKFSPKDYTYIESEESFYKIHTTGRTFADAKQTCDLEGATLYYAENVEEVNAVASFWNRTQPSIPWVWVGLTDKTTEGYFETIDRRPISQVYSNWQMHQPDNAGENEDCVHMDLKGTMNDYICDTKANFICKKSIQSLQGDYFCDKPNLDEQRDKKFFRKDYSYIESEESFYKVHTTGRTFADAKQMCALEGATLYYAENVDELNAVALFWNRTQPSIPWVWVGLTDKMVEGFFETIDRRPISEVYSNWQRFQPDNAGDNEDCVHMDLKGTMNDYICDTKANFICKKSLQSLQWNYNCDMPNLDYIYSKNTGKCYKLHTTALNWVDAYEMCRIEYTTLAVIENRMEADYLAQLTKSTPKPRVSEQHQKGLYHVGFHNRFKEGWQTVKGTPMNIDDDAWFDNYQPDENQYEECGSMFFNGRLINTKCDMKSLFICEREVEAGGSHSAV